MAVSRRGYILAALLCNVASFALVLFALASDQWVWCVARDEQLGGAESAAHYGLWRGQLTLNNLATPTVNTLYMTCVAEVSSCAVSCKTSAAARRAEVVALAERRAPSPACGALTTADDTPTLPEPAVIQLWVYALVTALVLAQAACALCAAGLCLLNLLRNPTEPALGLPGCLWSSCAVPPLGVGALVAFGALWASGLNTHLALSYIAIGVFTPIASLGYSYWMVLVSALASACAAALLVTRRVMLERDPPPPSIALSQHSDNTVFLY